MKSPMANFWLSFCNVSAVKKLLVILLKNQNRTEII